MRAFLLWLTAWLPVKCIGRDGDYAEWYHVLTIPGVARVQIHRFRRSDPDGLHDHPWGWARTFILAGWYIESRRDGIRIRAAGDTYALTGDTFHRVELPDQADVWTLFIHGPYVKHWGFLVPSDLLRVQDWRDPAGGLWLYRARPRDELGFSDWWKTAPKGSELRARRGS